MDQESDSELIQRLADEVTDQVRKGDNPSAEELHQRYAELDEDVDGLVDAISILEEASFRRRSSHARGMVVNATGVTHSSLGGFRLIREISRGGMGIVYEAEQKSLNRRVAVKVLPPSPLLSDVERARFQREGRAAGRLHHSNIVPVFGTGVEHNVQYCVMQLINGCSLDRLIAAMRRRCGMAPATSQRAGRGSTEDTEAAINLLTRRSVGEVDRFLPVLNEPPRKNAEQPVQLDAKDLPPCYWNNIALIGSRIASALSHAHQQGVLHRDVKPGNMILDHNGHIWLTDFGLAKLADKENLTVSGNLVGTLRYTPPEQFSGKTDARSDLYALGLTLYELCTLQPAFSGSDRRELMRKVATTRPVNPRSVNPQIPRDLETIILKSIAPEPEKRYQSAADQAADLKNFLEDRPLLARRQSIFERSWRWCRQHRLETALGGFALAMLLLFSVTASLAYLNEARNRRESEADAARTRAAIDRVFDSYLPDWTTSSTASAHGSVSVSPDTARLLEELADFYDDLARRPSAADKTEAVLDSADAFRRVGQIYLRLGRFGKSRVSYQHALARLARHYSPESSKRLRLEQARVLNDLGIVFWTEQRNAGARKNHERALSLIYEILPAPKADVATKFELSRTLYLMGRVSRGLGGSVIRQSGGDKSAKNFRARSDLVARAVGILERLIDIHPEKSELRHLLALCYREYASRKLDENGEPDDLAMKEALRMMEELVSRSPRHTTYQFALCTTLQWFKFGEDTTPTAYNVAAQRARRAANIASKLSRQRPDEWIYAAAQLEALIKLTNVLNRSGRLEDALAQSQETIEIGNKLTETYADSDVFKLRVGDAIRRRGDLLRKTGDSTAVLAHYDLAIDQLKQVAGSDQSELAIATFKNLRRASETRAEELEKLGRFEEASTAREETAIYQTELRRLLAQD